MNSSIFGSRAVWSTPEDRKRLLVRWLVLHPVGVYIHFSAYHSIRFPPGCIRQTGLALRYLKILLCTHSMQNQLACIKVVTFIAIAML